MNLYSHPIIMKSQNPEIEMAELHPLKNSIYQQYEDNVKVHTDEISRCEKKAKWFVIGQLAAFILAISCIAIYAMYYGETVVIVLAIFFVLAYITLRRMDVANGDKMERLKAVRSVYANEMAYINGDFKAFRDGKQYINPCHAYSFDMDVFGEQSLFQRINRTVTSGGSDYLAAQLGSASTRTRLEIEDQRDAINELADDYGQPRPQRQSSISHILQYILSERFLSHQTILQVGILLFVENE